MKALDLIVKMLETKLHVPVIAKCYTEGYKNTFKIVAVNEPGFGEPEAGTIVLTLNVIHETDSKFPSKT